MAHLEADRRTRTRHRLYQCLAHHAVQHPHHAVGRRPAAAVRHSTLHDAGAQALRRHLWRDHLRGTVLQPHPDCRCTGRLARSTGRADVFQARLGQGDLRHGQQRHGEHRRRASASSCRTGDQRRILGLRQDLLRLRGQHLQHRRHPEVDLRPAATGGQSLGDGGSGDQRSRQRRRLHRTGLLGAGGPLVEERREGRHTGADLCHHQGPLPAGRTGVCRLPSQRPHQRHGTCHRRTPERDMCRRRTDEEPVPDAVPGRHAGHPCGLHRGGRCLCPGCRHHERLCTRAVEELRRGGRLPQGHPGLSANS